MLRVASTARVALEHHLTHLIRSEVLIMKDVLFLVGTAAFFLVAWLYTKSFDQL